MKILYLTILEDTENNNIHKNQIFNLKSDLVDYKFLFLSPLFILNRSTFKINRNSFKDKQVKEIKIPIFSYNFFLHIFLIPYMLFLTVPILLFFILKFKPEVVHCRNLVSAFLVVTTQKIFKLRYKIITDPRSVYPEEGVIIKRWKYDSISFKLWKKIEVWVFKNSSACIGLSEYFTTYLSSFNQNSYYIPAIASSSFVFNQKLRVEERKRLGLDEHDVVLIYTGSIGLWHDVDMLIKIFDKAKSCLNGNLKIIALSGSEKLKNELDLKFHKERVFCGIVPTEQVVKYLSIADFGVVPGSLKFGQEYQLLYKTMIASKAEEYVCAGLPIIVNNRIINLTQYVNDYKWGIVYNADQNNFDLTNIEIFSKEQRNNISQSAIKLFGEFYVKKQILALYHKIININA